MVPTTNRESTLIWATHMNDGIVPHVLEELLDEHLERDVGARGRGVVLARGQVAHDDLDGVGEDGERLADLAVVLGEQALVCDTNKCKPVRERFLT